MKVVCAYCAAEGKPALIGEKAPLDDPRETHGICVVHQRRLAWTSEESFQQSPPGVREPDTCECQGRPANEAVTLILECLDCAGGVVTCSCCGKPAWWPNEQRRFALTACETHRWETGHTRVVVRGFGAVYDGQIVMEVVVE